MQQLSFLGWDELGNRVVTTGGQGGHNSPGAGSLWGRQITAGGGICLLGAPKSANNVTSTFFNTVNFLPKDLRFERGGAKLASWPGRRLTSLRRCSGIVSELFKHAPEHLKRLRKIWLWGEQIFQSGANYTNIAFFKYTWAGLKTCLIFNTSVAQAQLNRRNYTSSNYRSTRREYCRKLASCRCRPRCRMLVELQKAIAPSHAAWSCAKCMHSSLSGIRRAALRCNRLPWNSMCTILFRNARMARMLLLRVLSMPTKQSS